MQADGLELVSPFDLVPGADGEGAEGAFGCRQLQGAEGAFAALGADGALVAWGRGERKGKAPGAWNEKLDE